MHTTDWFNIQNHNLEIGRMVGKKLSDKDDPGADKWRELHLIHQLLFLCTQQNIKKYPVKTYCAKNKRNYYYFGR